MRMSIFQLSFTLSITGLIQFFFSIFAKLIGEKYETKSTECESMFLNLDFNNKNRKHRNELTKNKHIEFEGSEVHPHENLQKVFEHRDVEL